MISQARRYCIVDVQQRLMMRYADVLSPVLDNGAFRAKCQRESSNAELWEMRSWLKVFVRRVIATTRNGNQSDPEQGQ